MAVFWTTGSVNAGWLLRLKKVSGWRTGTADRHIHSRMLHRTQASSGTGLHVGLMPVSR